VQEGLPPLPVTEFTQFPVLQLPQAPHALLQQNPPAQKADEHAKPLFQVAPLAFFGTQLPFVQ